MVARAQDPVMIGVQFDEPTSILLTVHENGPAHLAGLRAGDEILTAGKVMILQPRDLALALKDSRVGETVRFEVKRGSEIRFFDLKLVRYTRGRIATDEELPLDAIFDDAELGIAGQSAPELVIEKWENSAEGSAAPSISDLKGKTVYLLFFQTSCLVSRRQAFPVLAAVQTHFSADSDVEFLAIQSAFDDFETNTLDNAVALLEGLQLQIPLVQDRTTGPEPETATAFNIGGTPWTVIIGPDGNVRFNGFRIDSKEAIKMIEEESGRAESRGSRDER